MSFFLLSLVRDKSVEKFDKGRRRSFTARRDEEKLLQKTSVDFFFVYFLMQKTKKEREKKFRIERNKKEEEEEEKSFPISRFSLIDIQSESSPKIDSRRDEHERGFRLFSSDPREDTRGLSIKFHLHLRHWIYVELIMSSLSPLNTEM